LVSDVLESDGGNHDNQKVEDPGSLVSPGLVNEFIAHTYQFADVERAFAGARIRKGTISAG
jgi:hypothetical protein